MPTITKPNSKYSLLESFTVTLLFVVFMSKLISSVKEFCLMSATGTVVSKLNHFQRYCVLPEIVGRWYTQKRSLSHSSPDPNSALRSFYLSLHPLTTGGPVVTCTNQACLISTFHLSCLKITKVPRKWSCSLC